MATVSQKNVVNFRHYLLPGQVFMAFIHTTAITKQFSIIDEKIQRIMPYTFKNIFISYQCDIALKLFLYSCGDNFPQPFTYNSYEKFITIGFKSGTMNFSLLDILTECGKNFIYVSYILYEVILINTRECRIIEQIEKYT